MQNFELCLFTFGNISKIGRDPKHEAKSHHVAGSRPACQRGYLRNWLLHDALYSKLLNGTTQPPIPRVGDRSTPNIKRVLLRDILDMRHKPQNIRNGGSIMSHLSKPGKFEIGHPEFGNSGGILRLHPRP